MDSLGMCFVLNLDDLASDLGFLGDVWNCEKVGKFYAALKSMEDPEAYSDGELKLNLDSLKHFSKELNRIPAIVYKVAQFMLMLLLPLAALSPFFLEASAEVD